MSTTKTAATVPAVTLERLRITIKDMDAMSQEGFGHIEALAGVALMALETPDAYRFPELIAQTLEAISNIAQASMNMVNVSAEEVGCNWTEASKRRRMDARRDAAAALRVKGQG
jgi:hypothetical protein